MASGTSAKPEVSAKKKTGWSLWLPRIGKFILYGGWMVIAFLAIAITIIVSMLNKG